MLSPADIQRLGERKYPAFLRALVTGEPFFPLEIRFGRPGAGEDWEKLQREISTLAKGGCGYRIDWTEVNTRKWGRQRFPARVWFETETEYVTALGKAKEIERMRADLMLIRDRCPELDPWLASNAPRLSEFSAVWPDLLKVCRYLRAQPRPGLYGRELPIEVDTKFIENHQAILRSLLDFLLPESARSQSERFEARFGLRYDEPQIRLRVLDPALTSRLGFPCEDLAVPLSQFRALAIPALPVIIVENKMTFLTLPRLPQGLGLWGGGGAAELLTSVEWLAACRLLYWGDLDIHGFHILSRLRRAFPTMQSVMMDAPTLAAFRAFAVKARASSYEEVGGLSAEESSAYAQVRDRQLLLEQEKVPHPYAVRELGRVLGILV